MFLHDSKLSGVFFFGVISQKNINIYKRFCYICQIVIDTVKTNYCSQVRVSTAKS